MYISPYSLPSSLSLSPLLSLSLSPPLSLSLPSSLSLSPLLSLSLSPPLSRYVDFVGTGYVWMKEASVLTVER